MDAPNHLPADAAAAASNKLLTTEEVATWLGIKKCTLEKARSMRLGNFPPYIRIGHVVRYRPTDVEAWLEQQAFNIDGSRAHPNVA